MDGAAAPWLAAALAVAAWWGATGALMWRVARADAGGIDAHRRSVALGTPLLAAGIAGVILSRGAAGPGGACAAFLSALAVWGWIELAFLSGVVTGPNRAAAVPGRGRFGRALGTVAHHEAALVLGFAGVLAASWGGAQWMAPATYAVLLAARTSAKINLYLGVPRFTAQFLPRPLAHLPSHFGAARLNRFFPVSVTLLTGAALLLAERAAGAGTPGAQAALALLATLTALAALEHWMMVLPVRDDGLWRWATGGSTKTGETHGV